MGSSPTKTAFQSFDEVKGTFYKDLQETNEKFSREIFNLVMSKTPFTENPKNANQSISNSTKPAKIKESDALPDAKAIQENNKAEIKAKDEKGNELDPSKANTQGNTYISIYDKQYMSVTYSNNKDYKGVKQGIDEYTKSLQDLVKVGVEAGTSAAAGPEAVVASLFSNAGTILGSIGSIIKTSLNLASVSVGVGIKLTNEKTFVPGGIYVCNLIYTANSSVETSSKTEMATMSLCRTIVATSTDLINAMRNQQLIAQQMTLLGSQSLDVVRKQGEIIGWSKVYPKYVVLSIAQSKAQFIKVSQEMAAYLASDKYKFTEQEPDISGKDLTDIKVYAATLDLMKQYGIWYGYKTAKDVVDSLIIASIDLDIADAREIINSSKEDLKELKTNSMEDYDKFYHSYAETVTHLQQMLGYA